MVKSLLATAALWPVEKIINAVLNADPHLQKQLAYFSGKQIEVETSSPNLTICILLLDKSVSLKGQSSTDLSIECDAKISGKLSTFQGLLLADPEQMPLANPDLEISGDSDLIHGVFKVMQSLDLRWDDLLAPFGGDVFTNSSKKVFDDARQWRRSTADSMSKSIDDYLTEEAKLLPSSSSVEAFGTRLAQLRLRLDRAAARTSHIQSQLPSEQNDN